MSITSLTVLRTALQSIHDCEMFYFTQHLVKGPEINFQKDEFACAAKSHFKFSNGQQDK